MHTLARPTRHLLDMVDVTDGFFEETHLIGIMAPVSDYLFCWQLNQCMGLDLRVNAELEIHMQRKTRDYWFSVYEWGSPYGCLMHYVYNNRFEGEYLLPDLRHLDYLWLMKGDAVDASVVQEYSECIRSIHGVQLVVELDVHRLKNKEHLVF